MDTSLIISSTNSGKKLQKAISNINPEKDNAVLKTFAQMVNGLSSNTYVDATRINKMSVEEEYQQGGGSTTAKLEPTFTVGNGTYEYNGDGEIFGYAEDGLTLIINRTTKAFYVDCSPPEKPGSKPFTVHFHATEGENYAAKTVTYTYEG